MDYLHLMTNLYDQIANFFATLSPQITSLLAIIGLLVFTFGLVLGWLIQRQSTRHFRQRALLMKTDRDVYESRNTLLEAERKTLGREAELANAEKIEALDRIRTLETEVADWERSSQRLLDKVSQLETTNQTYSSTIESLNDQVIGLKTQNERLSDDYDGPDFVTDSGADAGAGKWVEPAAQPEESSPDEEYDPPGEGAPLPSGKTDTQQLEERLQKLEDRLASLAEQREFGEAGPGTLYTVQSPAPDSERDDEAEPLVIRADITEEGARASHDGEPEVIVQASRSLQTPTFGVVEADRDDLTRIEKIGPFLEGQLHKVDIYRFEQIASWSAGDIDNYTELIGYVPGIIEQDDWVGQARRLAEETADELQTEGYETEPPIPEEETTEPTFEVDTSEAPSATAMAAEEIPTIEAGPDEPTPTDPAPNADDDNLRVVEGIGPRIQQLLRGAGIDTIGKLANSSTDTLQAILDEAGGSFRFHDPKTWVAQAGLAADGKIEELEEWQDQLKGGL